jgi:hypothetical protein
MINLNRLIKFKIMEKVTKNEMDNLIQRLTLTWKQYFIYDNELLI